MNTFHFSILTPQGNVFEDEVEAVVAPGALGSFGVLAHHAPMITFFTKGIIKVKVGWRPEEFFFTVQSGILEVKPENDVLVLADKAIQNENADQAKQLLATL